MVLIGKALTNIHIVSFLGWNPCCWSGGGYRQGVRLLLGTGWGCRHIESLYVCDTDMYYMYWLLFRLFQQFIPLFYWTFESLCCMFIKGNKICTLWSSKGAKKANFQIISTDCFSSETELTLTLERDEYRLTTTNNQWNRSKIRQEGTILKKVLFSKSDIESENSHSYGNCSCAN